jgi:hypothetical protein
VHARLQLASDWLEKQAFQEINDVTATFGELLGLGMNALISRLERVVRTLANTRTYSRHLTAASWKLWCKLVSTVDTLFNAVSMNMAFSWILNALCHVSTSPQIHRRYYIGDANVEVGSIGNLLQRFSVECLSRDF